jgi:predicted MFS family arabinose efflux permease
VIAVLMTGALLAVAQMHLTVPLLGGVAARYGVSLSAAAWVGAGFGFAFAVGGLLFGPASDRYDRRQVMTFGLVASAVAAAVVGASPTFGAMLVSRVVQGFVAAAFPPVALAYVGEVLPERRRAIGIASVSSSFLLAGIVGQSFAFGVDQLLGWRWAFWLLVPMLLACAAFVPRLPASSRTGAADLRATYAAFGDLLRRPALLMGYVCAVTMLLTFIGMYTGLNGAVAERYGITGTGPLLALRLAGLPGIAAGLAAGWLIGRIGLYRVAALSFLTGAVGLLVEATAGPLWLLLAGSGLYVAGLSAAIPAVVAAVVRASGSARGTGVAGYGFLVGLGGGIAPVLVTAVHGFRALCLLLAAVLVVAAAAIGLGPRPRAMVTTSG